MPCEGLSLECTPQANGSRLLVPTAAHISTNSLFAEQLAGVWQSMFGTSLEAY